MQIPYSPIYMTFPNVSFEVDYDREFKKEFEKMLKVNFNVFINFMENVFDVYISKMFFKNA